MRSTKAPEINMIPNKYWDESQPLLTLPRFRCTACHAGHFVVEIDSLRSKQTSQSIQEYEILRDIDNMRSLFIAIAICDNPNCKEPLAISGWSKNHWVPIEDDGSSCVENYQGSIHNYVDDFTITYLSAPIELIRVPIGIEHKLQELLDHAFLSFWSDSHTCANKVRHVLEYLLVEKLKVSTEGAFKPLGKLIEKFLKDETKSPLSKHFNALKILGNSGSHITDNKIGRSELMNAFKVLESLLVELYKDISQIDELSDEIIQKRTGK